MGVIKAVCISKEKGTRKEEIGSCRIIENYGLEGDAHAGSGRQVSLLSFEAVEQFRDQSGAKELITPGVFGENLLVSGYNFPSYPVGTVFKTGDVILEITQIGKTCHAGCEISKLTGECIMPRQGVFAKVLKGGTVHAGDAFTRVHTVAVLTSSDRAFAGEREDESGPLMAKILCEAGYDVIETVLIPDDEERAYRELIRIADELKPDVLFTTGGTGFSPRDHMPEATLRAGEINAPGIAEAIRAYSMTLTPRAMLSRAVSVLRGKTIIVNLPGNPKAVQECLAYILPTLAHGIEIRNNEVDG
ncbi:MAG: MOSC domain-containing protein [Lachnospiraceae bacterium]|nr:MOSC domain-containing protein [Lachnospiraceae bacterium]